MALATRCPSCSTVFRISTAQAAAKGGMVRCGVCRATFNALDALVRVEDLDVVDESDVAEAADDRTSIDGPVVETTGASDAVSVAEPIDASAEAVEPIVEAHANRIVDESPGDATDGPGGPEPSVTRDEASVADFVTTTSDDARSTTDEPVARNDAIVMDTTVEPIASTDAVVTDAVTTDPLGPIGRRTDPTPLSMALDGTQPTFMRPGPPVDAEGRAARWTYGLLSLVAALALVAQAAYLWRDEIAARFPPARSLLSTVCGPLRCVVDQPAHPAAISIESASVQASGTLDVYVLTALLRNRESIDVRYPHLELVLTDLQDRPILRRALRPEDYLPSAASRDVRGGFPAESELPIRVMFELNGLRFVGYRLDRFYP